MPDNGPCLSVCQFMKPKRLNLNLSYLPDIYVFVQDRQTLNSSVGSVIEARKRLKFVKRSI